jgi:signal transduction histidine kinase
LIPFKVKQVFVNLVNNALQAMPTRGTLTICTMWFSAQNISEIAIQDTGSGIPQDNKKKGFNPFFTTRTEGVGLGLSIVQQLIGAHGARTQVESQPGQGSEF